MPTHFVRIALIIALVLGLTACVSDRAVTLRYTPEPGLERLQGAQALTVFRFSDRRGDEGDGNPLRVGGIYGGYGNRLAKVLAETPWPEALAQDLTAAFSARGVETLAMADREYAPGTTAVSTPLALGGEIRNFSTEGRWTIQAHVGGIIRLYDQQGALLVEKQISARIPRDDDGHLLKDEPGSVFEKFLNAAVKVFVRRVVTDPDVTQRLATTR